MNNWFPYSSTLVVLVVDEQQIFIDLLMERVGDERVRVIGTTSVDEAKARLATDQPNVLILDADMPQALDVIQAVRSAGFVCPVVAITRSDEVRHQLEALSIEAILSKRAHLNVMLRSLRNYTHGTLHLSIQHETQILVVDDDDAFRESLLKWFTNRGYLALTASTGREALKLMEEDLEIDIALLDIQMPDMGGMEVLSTIRTWKHHPQVIMVTAIEDGLIARRAEELGAFDYLVKPVDTSALEQLIVACFAHAEYQRQSWWKRLIGKSAPYRE